MNISLTLTLAAHKLPALADALAAANLLESVQVSDGAPSAMVTPEKQQAARDSTAAGKKTKVEKDTKAPETPLDALKQAVKDEKTEPPARVYETSGLPEKVAKAVTKNRDAVVALLEKYEAKKDGKMSAKFLAAEHFDAFEVGIDAILAPTEDLG